MSEIKVNKLTPRTNCGTVTLGDTGDTFTIPAGVSISNQGTASGFGSTGEISWVTTKKTTGFTVTVSEGYFCDTSTGGFTVTLPAGVAGNAFAVADYTNTFNTGNLTISPNGSQKIGGVAEDAVLTTEGQSAYFVYVDDTEGWKNVIDSTSNIIGAPPYITATGGCITTCGNCKVHTFNSPGTFVVSATASCATDNIVSYVIVAGGGGGAKSRGGGGGAGGYREIVSPSSPYTGSPLDGYPSAPNRVTVSATPYPIVVGGGGAGGQGAAPITPSLGIGTSGDNSSFGGIVSAGGGGGAPGDANSPPYGPTVAQRTGLAGGSGGGGGSGNDGGGCGGAGNTPPTTPAQGKTGGNANGSSVLSAGGGGATALGLDGGPSTPGFGGAGATSSINFSPTARGGGGGGGSPSPDAGSGGAGGGGSGGGPSANGTAGTVNLGGGGGGGGSPDGYDGGNGGSGVVIIRYRYQ